MQYALLGANQHAGESQITNLYENKQKTWIKKFKTYINQVQTGIKHIKPYRQPIQHLYQTYTHLYKTWVNHILYNTYTPI